jgi:hypothetical protein
MSLTIDAPSAAGMAPAMTGAEQALLRAAAAGAAEMMEFGCGGSTALLLEAGAGVLVSVDSDAAWLARVAAGQAPAVAAGRLVQWHADLGPVGEWGWPLHKPGPLEGWMYWGAPWQGREQPRGPVALVLVDGRFRVACALAAHNRLTADGLVAIHDYWPRRAYQEGLAPFFEVVGSAGSMALLAPRVVAEEKLLAARRLHAADPR